jgi:hypothetical protein
MLTHTLPVGRKCSIRELYKKILLSAFVLYFYLKLQCFVVAVEYQSTKYKRFSPAELVKLIEGTGVSALAVHGRTKDQRPNDPNNVAAIR